MRSNSLPTSFETIMALWSRNFLQFRKTWLISLFWIVLEPLFMLGALGYGLGSYVSQVQGMSYLEFFFPALLCSSAVMVAYFEGTYANFTKLSHSKLYHAMLLAPMNTAQLLAGEVLWAATKGLFSAIGVLTVASLMGAVGSFQILAALPVIFLASAVFAIFGMLVTSLVRNYDQIIYATSGLIMPMSLFSGTYFPLQGLPKALQAVAMISPLTHAVMATRELQQGKFTSGTAINIAILFLFLIVVGRFTQKKFDQRLID